MAHHAGGIMTEAQNFEAETQVPGAPLDGEGVTGDIDARDACTQGEEEAEASVDTNGEAEAEVDTEGETEADVEVDTNGEAEAEVEVETEEVFELEVDEDSIVGYIVDQDDTEIGIIVLDENGAEQEFYYVDMDQYELVEEPAPEPAAAPKKKKADDDEYDLGITREGVAEATSDINDIYKDGAQIAAELKSTFDEINESFAFLKKKK
jgi:hypothetical protein